MKVGKGLAIFWLAILGCVVVAIFWYNEWIYSLPTPVPASYRVINTREYVGVASKIRVDPSKPLFLHFFNPDCPCSRFNAPHFRTLVESYGDKVTFVAVPMIMYGKEYTDQEIQDKIGLNIPVWRERGVAEACGVYSTPQAVILNSDHTLYYRGNYNKSRYCTDKRSNYAEMAIASLLKNAPITDFDPMALKAYGCTIEGCIK